MELFLLLVHLPNLQKDWKSSGQFIMVLKGKKGKEREGEKFSVSPVYVTDLNTAELEMVASATRGGLLSVPPGLGRGKEPACTATPLAAASATATSAAPGASGAGGGWEPPPGRTSRTRGVGAPAVGVGGWGHPVQRGP